jgi:hypothetical protein
LVSVFMDFEDSLGEPAPQRSILQPPPILTAAAAR